MTEGILPRLIAEGKTKRLHEYNGSKDLALVISKDDITAGDGARHDVIPGKGMMSNETTCAVFGLLQNDLNVPLAFISREGASSFVARLCRMLPYEVVVRREAHGSYCKRNRGVAKRTVFPRLIVEFYLKTSGKKWKDTDLRSDDPFIVFHFAEGQMDLYEASKPLAAQEPIQIPTTDVFTTETEDTFEQMAQIARRVFLILEKAWQLLGHTIVDLKVEFGIDSEGRLLLADVIDNDSWRLLDSDGAYVDKQVYREGSNLELVTANYQMVMRLAQQFRVPDQKVVVWRGSDKDDLAAFRSALSSLDGVVEFVEVTRSLHKEPVRGVIELHQLLQAPADTVLVAFIGMSNGAGPILAANCTVPVIAVPATAKDFPDDVWSSLRVPSMVPLLTVLSPANAVRAALQMLAMRNPVLYAALRLVQEERFTNVVELL